MASFAGDAPGAQRYVHAATLSSKASSLIITPQTTEKEESPVGQSKRRLRARREICTSLGISLEFLLIKRPKGIMPLPPGFYAGKGKAERTGDLPLGE